MKLKIAVSTLGSLVFLGGRQMIPRSFFYLISCMKMEVICHYEGHDDFIHLQKRSWVKSALMTSIFLSSSSHQQKWMHFTIYGQQTFFFLGPMNHSLPWNMGKSLFSNLVTKPKALPVIFVKTTLPQWQQPPNRAFVKLAIRNSSIMKCACFWIHLSSEDPNSKTFIL